MVLSTSLVLNFLLKESKSFRNQNQKFPILKPIVRLIGVSAETYNKGKFIMKGETLNWVKESIPWKPLPYMKKAVKFLLGHAAGALFLDPG